MKRQPTEAEKILMEKSLQKIIQNDIVVVYGYATKRSQSFLSMEQQRLVMLHSGDKSIRYYKEYQGNLLISKISEIPEPQKKAILYIDKVNDFKCTAERGKTTSVKMQWKQDKKQKQRYFTFSSKKMMNEWIAAVQQLKAGTINKDPTFAVPQNDLNQSQKPNTTNSNTNVQPSGSQLLQNNRNSNPVTQANKIQPKPLTNSTQPVSQPVNQPSGSLTQPQSQTPPQQNHPNSVLNTNSTGNPMSTSTNAYNPYTTKPNTGPMTSTSPPAINSSQNATSSPIVNNPIPSTSANLSPQYTANPNLNTNTNTNTNPNPNPNTSTIANPNSNPNPVTTGTSVPASINPNPIPQYGDVATQIRALRQAKPQKFILSNQSRKDLLANNNQPEVKDNIETKRDPYSAYPSNQSNTPAFNKKNTIDAPFILSEPAQQPNPGNKNNPNAVNQPSYSNTLNPPNPNLNPNPNPYSSGNSSVNPSSMENSRQSNTNPIAQSQMSSNNPNLNQPGSGSPIYDTKQKQNMNKNGQQSRKYNPTSKSPANQSEFYPQDNPNRTMNRAQSQNQNVHNPRTAESGIRSQLNYPHKQDIIPVRHSRRWNQQWCSTQKPIQLYEQFIKQCQKISIQIIDQLPFPKSSRQYSALKYQSPYFMYVHDGITYNMHFFGEDGQQIKTSRDDQMAPILYDHQTYTQAKREFYHYDFLIAVTGNRGIFKVPLSCYIEYKGVLIFCRANVPEGFEKVSPNYYQKQLQQLQSQIKMRFVFNSMSLFLHPQKKYFLITNLQQLIPRLPTDIRPYAYFRKQFLLQSNLMIQNQSSLGKLYQKLQNENVKQFVNRFQSLESWVINSADFMKELHRSGISAGCLNQIYELTSFPFFKKIIVSEMAKAVFCDILRSQLNSVYSTFPARQFDQLTVDYVDNIILDCAHIMLNQLFSYSSRSENIWRMIVKEVNKKYKVVISKEDIIPGYLLGGIMGTICIDCDYKVPSFNKKQSFFVSQNTIPRQLLINFYPKVRRYDLQTVSPLLGRIKQILQSQPSPDSYQQLVRSLDLKNNEIPSFCQPLKAQIITYLCNFIPLGEHEQFQHLGIYDMLQYEPHTYCSTKVSLLAIKWAAKKKNQELANKIFEIKFQQNSFWISEFNPAISQFYDFFSLYNISVGNYEEGVKLAKSSLINSIKLTGANSLPVADKHYQLGNIFFKIGRKQEALKQYLKTKQILQHHKQTSIPEYGVILLKLSLLYLNFGKISDCVGSSLQALKIFDTNGGNEQQEIQTFQILSRSYEITRKVGDLNSVGALCAQKFNNTQNPKIFERMMKIVLLPKLSTINNEDSKTILKLIGKLQQLESPISYIDAFNYLHARSYNQIIMKKVFSFFDNVSNLYEDIMRKDMLRKHKSLSNQPKSEAADLLVVLEAVITMTGYNFINGSLRENYY